MYFILFDNKIINRLTFEYFISFEEMNLYG